MRTYKNLFSKMLEKDNMEACLKKAARGKSGRTDVSRVLCNKERYLDKLKQLLTDGDFYFRKGSTALVNKHSEKKERLIAKPHFVYDQIVHHLLVSQLEPIVMKSLYEFSCGSVPGRGPHYGKKYMEKWIKSYKDKRFYVFKGDIKHFYDSIDHDVLKNKLQRKINDPQYLDLLFKLIDAYEPGIAKGYYTSQWLANFLLSDFDHYVKEVLKAPHYMRYLDDIVILSPNKRKLRKIKDGIEEYLSNELHLQLKENWQIYQFKDKDDNKGRDIDFMGFRFYRHKTTLRKSNLKRIRRKANKLAKKRKAYNQGTGKGVNTHDAMAMLSYLGWTKHADVYGFYQRYIKPKVNKRQLRKKVSYNQKRLNILEKKLET